MFRRKQLKQPSIEIQILAAIARLQQDEDNFVTAAEIMTALGGGVRLSSTLDRMVSQGLLRHGQGPNGFHGDRITEAGRAMLAAES